MPARWFIALSPSLMWWSELDSYNPQDKGRGPTPACWTLISTEVQGHTKSYKVFTSQPGGAFWSQIQGVSLQISVAFCFSWCINISFSTWFFMNFNLPICLSLSPFYTPNKLNILPCNVPLFLMPLCLCLYVCVLGTCTLCPMCHSGELSTE